MGPDLEVRLEQGLVCFDCGPIVLNLDVDDHNSSLDTWTWFCAGGAEHDLTRDYLILITQVPDIIWDQILDLLVHDLV